MEKKKKRNTEYNNFSRKKSINWKIILTEFYLNKQNGVHFPYQRISCVTMFVMMHLQL